MGAPGLDLDLSRCGILTHSSPPPKADGICMWMSSRGEERRRREYIAALRAPAHLVPFINVKHLNIIIVIIIISSESTFFSRWKK